MNHCYLCGVSLVKNVNRSRDHVPPDCIYPPKKPPNLITIPCCKDCNKKYERLDEKMRNCFGIIAGKKAGVAGNIAMKQLSTSRKWLNAFLSHTREHPVLTDSDGNHCLVYYFDKEELRTWLIRVVKGLFYHRFKTRINDAAIFKIEPCPEIVPHPSDTFPMENGLEFRPYFTYGLIREINTDAWVIIFYDHLIFLVSVDNPV